MDDNIQDKLKAYQALLNKWQSKINLISSSTLENAWERHFEDSVQVSDYIPQGTKTLFDLGSGGGFPGLVLAMVRPELDVHLVESDQKKCIFLKTVSRETQSPVTVHQERIEHVSCETVPDVISARALASLPKLFDYCQKWIEGNPDLILIFPKGEKADVELEALSKEWGYDCCTYQSKTDENAKTLVFSKACKL